MSEVVEKTQVSMTTNTFLEQLKSLEALQDYIDKQVAKKLSLKPEDPYESKGTDKSETDKISEALAKAQGEFPRISFNRNNPYLKRDFTDLDMMVHSVKTMLEKNGLSVTQIRFLTDEGSTILKTRLRHSSGQWIEDRARINPFKNDPQSIESYTAFMKRMAYAAILNITIQNDPHDDDGERSMLETRAIMAKGVELNTNYTKLESSYEVITREQLVELERELVGNNDLAKDIMEYYRIQSIADIPQSEYFNAKDKVMKLKKLRNDADKRIKNLKG